MGFPMEGYVGPDALVELIGGALRLRLATYREVSRQAAATRLSLAVVVLAGAASAPAIGPSLGLVLPVAMVLGVLLTLGILGLEASMVWGICRLALRERRSMGEVMRPLAVAHAPRVLYLLVPLVGDPPILQIAVSLWLLGAFVIAVEAAIDRGFVVAVSVALVVGVLRWLLDALIEGL